MKKSGSSQRTDVGTVLATTRRTVSIFTASEETVAGQLSTKALDVTVGDHVQYSSQKERIFVEQVDTARNCLTRTYFNQVRRIVANVDHLYIFAALPPLFNTTFVDRVLALARLEDIPATLLINKVDKGLESLEPLIAIYEKLGVDILLTSAKSGEGIGLLRSRLEDPEMKLVVLTGISGVGKSAILNLLVPDAAQRVGDVSEKTGQGKQTTAQAIGHLYPRDTASTLVVVDLPGIQNFGFAHVQKNLISAGFAEIEELQGQCAFGNCSHTREEDCAVKRAVNTGEIAESRFQSYCDILAEIEEAKPY